MEFEIRSRPKISRCTYYETLKLLSISSGTLRKKEMNLHFVLKLIVKRT